MSQIDFETSLNVLHLSQNRKGNHFEMITAVFSLTNDVCLVTKSRNAPETSPAEIVVVYGLPVIQ